MAALHIRLDPTKMGSGAKELKQNLRRLIVGQDEAIQAIVTSYQMHLSGMNPPGRPIANFLFLGPQDRARLESWKSAPNACWGILEQS